METILAQKMKRFLAVATVLLLLLSALVIRYVVHPQGQALSPEVLDAWGTWYVNGEPTNSGLNRYSVNKHYNTVGVVWFGPVASDADLKQALVKSFSQCRQHFEAAYHDGTLKKFDNLEWTSFVPEYVYFTARLEGGSECYAITVPGGVVFSPAESPEKVIEETTIQFGADLDGADLPLLRRS